MTNKQQRQPYDQQTTKRLKGTTMKRNKLIGVLVGAIALTSLGGASFAVAQTLNNMKQSLLSSSNQTEFKMDEITPAQDAQEWQEMKQRFIRAGINLTPQQETTMRQAVKQLRTDMRPVFQDNPLATFAQLIAAATLPAPQGEALMKVECAHASPTTDLGTANLAGRRSIPSRKHIHR
jgi:uncharacterized membrane protein